MLQKLFKALGVTSKKRTAPRKKSAKKASKRKTAVKKASKKRRG
jgi:hypothetical protein